MNHVNAPTSTSNVIPLGEPAGFPRAPRTLDETGLPLLFLVELATKLLFVRGQMRLTELSQQLRLPAIVLESLLAFMRAERICEVMRRGETDGDILYELTDAGRARASEYLGRCKYAGAAPVSLAAYVAQVERQSVTKMNVTREGVNDAFRGLIVKPEVRDQLGAAMGSGRALFLYGPAGAGKTTSPNGSRCCSTATSRCRTRSSSTARSSRCSTTRSTRRSPMTTVPRRSTLLCGPTSAGCAAGGRSRSPAASSRCGCSTSTTTRAAASTRRRRT